MAESQLQAGVAVTIVVSATNDSLQFARLNTAAVAGRVGFDYDAIEDVRIAISELCGTVIGCAAQDAELHLEIMGTPDGITVRGRTTLANGESLERDELSDQVLHAFTDAYNYEVADGVVSFEMNRARTANE